MLECGMVWKKGQSGNPGGRPKGMGKLIRSKLGENNEDGVNFFIAVANGDMAALNGMSVTLDQRMKAWDWLTVRGHGKSVDVVEVKRAATIETSLEQYTDEQLTEREVLIARLRNMELDLTSLVAH